MLHRIQAITDRNHIRLTKSMIKVILSETAKELFQLNMSQSPSIGDELMVDDKPYLITGRRFIIEDTERDTKNVNNTILYAVRV